MNETIKSKIKAKHILYVKYIFMQYLINSNLQVLLSKNINKSDKKLISGMDIVHSYTATVRGYHYSKQFWKSIENEELRCLHKKFNFYDSFAVKTVHKNDETVDHLPRQLSRVRFFFFLDRGDSMHVKSMMVALGSRRDGNSMYFVLQHATNSKECTTSRTISAIS